MVVDGGEGGSEMCIVDLEGCRGVVGGRKEPIKRSVCNVEDFHPFWDEDVFCEFMVWGLSPDPELPIPIKIKPPHLKLSRALN